MSSSSPSAIRGFPDRLVLFNLVCIEVDVLAFHGEMGIKEWG